MIVRIFFNLLIIFIVMCINTTSYVHWGYVISTLAILNCITKIDYSCFNTSNEHNIQNSTPSPYAVPNNPIVFHYIIYTTSVSMPDAFICSICLNSNINDKCCRLKCNHVYHSACMDNWINTCIAQNKQITCPECRNLLQYEIKEMRKTNRHTSPVSQENISTSITEI